MGKLAKVTEVTGCTTIQAMLERSGTDWDAYSSDAGGGFRRLARQDNDIPLAYVGERFRANNHRAQLYSLDAMVQSGEIVPATVSLWDNGAMLAFQFRCPNLDVVIRDRDVVSPLLTLAFGYGSLIADSSFFADFRWACKNQNGKVAELNRDGRVKHRGQVVNRFADLLGERIGQLSGELSGRYEAMRAMTTTPIKGRALAEYFGESLGASKEDIDRAWVTEPSQLSGLAGRIPEILECYQADDAGAPGTVWQAYNAVTRYETHKDGRNEATRNRRMLLGAGETVAHNAFTLAARLAA